MSDPISPLGSPGQVPMASGASQPLTYVRANQADPTGVPAASSHQVSETMATRQDNLVGEVPKDKKDAPPTLEESVNAMREFLKNLPTNLEVKADKETGYLIYKVVNPVTKEVIRQYPPDEMIALARRMRALASKDGSGILLDRNL